MKYFFRDLRNDGNADGDLSFHAAGVVMDDIIPEPSISGKDVSVLFLHPFTGQVNHEWRALADIELMEPGEWHYERMKSVLNQIETSLL